MVLPALEVVIGALGKAQVLLEYFAQMFFFCNTIRFWVVVKLRTKLSLRTGLIERL